MQTLVDTKMCTDCKNIFPATSEYFYKNGRPDKKLRSYCKDCNFIRVKSWRKNNPKQYKNIRQKYYANHKDEIIEKVKSNPNNKEIWKRKSKKQRDFKKLNGNVTIKESVILEFYGTNCYLCDMPIDFTAPRQVGLPGWRSGLHIEHVVAKKNGGSDTLENVRPSHAWCNLAKGVA